MRVTPILISKSWMMNSPPPPTYVKAVGFEGQIDRRHHFEYIAPATVIQNNGAIDAGKGAGDGTKWGEVGYNKGVYTAAVVAEAIRHAQEMAGTSQINAVQFRDAMETLEVTDAEFEALGLGGFAPAISLSCEGHSSPRLAALQQWNAGDKTWTMVSDYMEPDFEIVDPLIEEDSMAYADENGIELRFGNRVA